MAYRPTEKLQDPAVTRELQKVAAQFNLASFNTLKVLAKAPAKSTDGDVVVCDGINWNPLADGIKRPIWFEALTGTWKKFS